jgi:adenylate cyclase
MMKKLLLSPWTALLTLMLVLVVRISDPTFVESVRLRYFDTLITSKTPTENNIYTVNIDEDSLTKYGQWPLPRGEYAKIVEELYKRNAGLVVFNVLMPDADRAGQDKQLAKTLQQFPVILPSIPNDKTKNSPRSPGSAVIGSDNSGMIVSYPGLIANTPLLENAAAGIGIVSTLPEVDGVNRRIPLVITVDGKIYPSLAIETLRVAAGDSTVQVKLNENGVEKMRIPKFGPISTDSLGRIWIDWSQTSKNHSLLDLPKDFNGGIVIVGTTAAGLSNPLPTSKGSVYPHEVQAQVLGTMMNGVVIQRPDYLDGIELLTLCLSSVLLLFLTRWLYVGLASVIVLCISVVFSSSYLYSNYLVLFDITTILVGIVLIALHAYGVKFVSEFLQKMQIKKQFGSYLSPAMVEKLQKNPELLQLGGESRELSIMFTDVRGFTSISEHYGKDVQGLTKIMNRYMTAMTSSILEYQGTLDKYIGDAQMAFWNAPLDDPRHAHNAVESALQMLETLDDFNKEILEEGIPAFGMGLGINTDTVVVGNMGSSQRFDYTCLGDGVNLASRLEGQSKPYGVRIILGPKTNELIRDGMFTLELDEIAVKGKTDGVNIYTVLVTDPQSMAEYLLAREGHVLMLAYYREQEWNKSLNQLSLLRGEFDCKMDHYYDMMVDRIGELRESNLSADWDGVYRPTGK